MWLVLFFHWPQRKMWFLFLFCDLLQVRKLISCTRYLLDVIQRSTFQNIMLITPVVWLVHSEGRLQRQISLNIDFSFIAGLDTPLGKDAHPWMRTQHTSLHAHAKTCSTNFKHVRVLKAVVVEITQERMAFQEKFWVSEKIIFCFCCLRARAFRNSLGFCYAH